MCPQCKTVLEMENIFPDKFCERQIAELETCCPNKHHGCKWTGPFKFCKVCSSFYFLGQLSQNQYRFYFALAIKRLNYSRFQFAFEKIL